jgi:hypothetical protein
VERYPFEHLSAAHWPNIISLEFIINTPHIETVRETDELIHFIKYKWKLHNVPEPMFVILELWRMNGAFDWYTRSGSYAETEVDPKCDYNPIEFNENVTKTLMPPATMKVTDGPFNHVMPWGPYYQALARFYKIPMIGGSDVFWPSFVRFYSKYRNCARWPMIQHDSVHISRYAGKIFVEKIIVPLFVEKYLTWYSVDEKDFLPKDGRESDYSQYITDHIRMFPYKDPRSMMIRYAASIWGVNNHNSFEEDIVYADPSFHFTHLVRHEESAGHQCYGSGPDGEKGSIVQLSFPIIGSWSDEHVAAQDLLFSLQVGFLHSWNTSYIGNIECQVYRAVNETEKELQDKTKTRKLVAPYDLSKLEKVSKRAVVIHGMKHDQEEMKSTGPRLTAIANELTVGTYLLQCEKLDAKLACFTGIRVVDVGLKESENFSVGY